MSASTLNRFIAFSTTIGSQRCLLLLVRVKAFAPANGLEAARNSPSKVEAAAGALVANGKVNLWSLLSDSYLIPEATLNCAPLKSVNMRVQCLRKGISRNLDEHRRVYNEQIDDVEAAFKEVVARYEMPFKLTFNAVRGFHLTLSERGFSLGDLPPGFIKVRVKFSLFSVLFRCPPDVSRKQLSLERERHETRHKGNCRTKSDRKRAFDDSFPT